MMTGQKIQMTHNILFSDKKIPEIETTLIYKNKIATDGGGGAVVV